MVHEDVYISNISMIFFLLGTTVRYVQMDFD